MSLKPLIALTHIPKCAGSSFRESLINPNFSDDEIYRPKSLKLVNRIFHDAKLKQQLLSEQKRLSKSFVTTRCSSCLSTSLHAS